MAKSTRTHTRLFQFHLSRLTMPDLFLRRALIKTVVHTSLILAALASTPALRAQTCSNIPEAGTESMSVQVTIDGTSNTVTDGMMVPANTVLRIDSVATATGTCTGMAWFCSGGCTCAPTGYVYNRNINHTKAWVDISTSSYLNGAYTVGYVWGTTTDLNVLDTHSSDSTGPNYLWMPYPGSYQIHVQATINGTPCSLTPYETEDVIITVHAGERDGATDFGETSCPNRVGKPINVTTGNMYVQQTDYRLPGLGEGLELTRTFNSKSQRDGIFGYGWTSTYEESLNIYGASVLRLNLPDGRAVYFARSSPTAAYLPAQPRDFHGARQVPAISMMC